MRQDNLAAPEVKSGGSGDVAEAFDDFMHAFDEFKQANDERLAQIESRFGVDGGDQGGKVGVSLFEAFLQFFGGFF